MLGIVIDAAVLIVLLKTISEEEIGFGTALLVALGTSVGTMVLALGLASLLGLAGVFVAAVLAAAALGAVVSALFGVEIKRSFMIGGIFMLVHVGMGIAFELMFRS